MTGFVLTENGNGTHNYGRDSWTELWLDIKNHAMRKSNVAWLQSLIDADRQKHESCLHEVMQWKNHWSLTMNTLSLQLRRELEQSLCWSRAMEEIATAPALEA